jgi:hypothetical protein
MWDHPNNAGKREFPRPLVSTANAGSKGKLAVEAVEQALSYTFKAIRGQAAAMSMTI